MVPVSPASKRYLIVEFKSLFYIDHNVPFGLASASGLQGEVADATVDIWHSLRVGPVIKWVDDFNAFHYANKAGLFSGISDGVVYRYDYDLDFIKAMIAPLGIPWHTTKGSTFGDIFSYVGFEWDLTYDSDPSPYLMGQPNLTFLHTVWSQRTRPRYQQFVH